MVIRQTKGGSYVIREVDGAISRKGIAVFRLIPYITREELQLDSQEEDLVRRRMQQKVTQNQIGMILRTQTKIAHLNNEVSARNNRGRLIFQVWGGCRAPYRYGCRNAQHGPHKDITGTDSQNSDK